MPRDKGRRMIGVEPSEDILRWIWDNKFAAIAGDMPGFERAPDEGEEEPLHQWLLAGWGCPIGEMFDLEELARELERVGRYSFFLSSMPLKVCSVGVGVGGFTLADVVTGAWWCGESAECGGDTLVESCMHFIQGVIQEIV